MTDPVKLPIPGASPVFYLWELAGIVAVARELGYALAVHGSLARDLDIIACPWTETATSALSMRITPRSSLLSVNVRASTRVSVSRFMVVFPGTGRTSRSSKSTMAHTSFA